MGTVNMASAHKEVEDIERDDDLEGPQKFCLPHHSHWKPLLCDSLSQTLTYLSSRLCLLDGPGKGTIDKALSWGFTKRNWKAYGKCGVSPSSPQSATTSHRDNPYTLDGPDCQGCHILSGTQNP